MTIPDRIRTLISTAILIAAGSGCAPMPQADAIPGDAAMTTKPIHPVLSPSGYDITPLPAERVEQLASKLDPETYRITQHEGTERPFCGTLLDNKKDGFYACVVCGLPLFSSEHKFNSGTGWPSFYREFDPDHVVKKSDDSLGMARVEIECARCGSHLGHVFPDGPKPTGMRHCLNSASLTFYEKNATLPPESLPAQSATTGNGYDATATGAPAGEANATKPGAGSGDAASPGGARTETAYFAGGCFWGVEHYFQEGPGVIDAESGYMQGHTDNPTYEQICRHGTGHAETVKVVFDPTKISYRRLLEAFFVMHDPTQMNRQGPDVGDQYRSGIWTANEQQQRLAEAFIAEQTAKKAFGGRKIVTQVEPAKTFWPAEEYHQDYIANTGRACHVANPW